MPIPNKPRIAIILREGLVDDVLTDLPQGDCQVAIFDHGWEGMPEEDITIIPDISDAPVYVTADLGAISCPNRMQAIGRQLDAWEIPKRMHDVRERLTFLVARAREEGGCQLDMLPILEDCIRQLDRGGNG